MCINQPWDSSISNIFTLIHQIFSGTKPALTTHELFKEDNLLDKRKNISEKVIKEKISINPLELTNLIKLLDSGNIKAVINRINVLLKHYPSSDTLLNILGAAYKKLGDLEQAEDKFKRAGNINPLNTNSFNNLGFILSEKGNINDAIAAYKKVLKINPNDFETHASLGNLFYKSEKFGKAINAYKTAIKINPNYAEAHNDLAILYKNRRNLKAAVSECIKAIKINPKYFEALLNFGNILREQNRLDESVIVLNKALSIMHDSPDVYNSLGVTYLSQRKFNKAIVSFESAINLKPDFAEPYYNIGMTLKENNNLKEAITYFRKAIEKRPNYASAYSNMGLAFHSMQIFEEAISSYESALHHDPSSAVSKHLLDSLKGQTTKEPPLKYVESLFDAYAEKFDVSLTRKLEYTAPTIIKKMMSKYSNSSEFGSVLDLGCGTGLIGEQIYDNCNSLIGIDVSQKMLDKAVEKKLYDALIRDDISSYLTEKKLDYDYFILADVLIYLGDASPIFRLIRQKNLRDAKIIFTVEDNSKELFFLEKSGRYSHSQKYIGNICKENNFRILEQATTNLRIENNFYIPGRIYLLEFSTK